MSLLGDLKLAYETLADDPIEMGIHYGRSILDALDKVSQPQKFAFAPAAASYDFQPRPEPSRPTFRTAPVIPAIQVPTSRSTAPAPVPATSAASAVMSSRVREISTSFSSRRDYSNYVSRSTTSRSSSPMYAQRNMIGAL